MHWCAGTGPADGSPTVNVCWSGNSRQAPDGDQVDLVDVMEIADGLIQYRRVYWGWFGTPLLTRSGVDKVRKNSLRTKYSLTWNTRSLLPSPLSA